MPSMRALLTISVQKDDPHEHPDTCQVRHRKIDDTVFIQTDEGGCSDIQSNFPNPSIPYQSFM